MRISMKFFIDTANLQHIEDILKKGFVSGITTNPSLIAKEPNSDYLEHCKKIVEICRDIKDVPLSVEVFTNDPNEMYDQSMSLLDGLDYDGANIKIPVGYEELEVVNRLYQNGVDVNVTCCFTESQMEFSALAGARYVSLFYNRLLDWGGDPNQVLKNVRETFDNNGITSEIIVGSIRYQRDVENSWKNGGHIITAGYNLFPSILQHSQTTFCVEKFISDFSEWSKNEDKK